MISAVHAAIALAVKSLWKGSAGPLLDPTMVICWLHRLLRSRAKGGRGEAAAGGGSRRRQRRGGQAQSGCRGRGQTHPGQQSTIPPQAAQPGRLPAPEQTWRLQHPSGRGALRGGCSDHRGRMAMRQRGASHAQMASWPRRPCGAVAGPLIWSPEANPESMPFPSSLPTVTDLVS